ncbi:ABC transporter permease [Niabella hibiscisoli]|uniref:ABC transporter permease n=1 Tax=Niabella hibiscisoli TaxID=1825928 RepID=UPI001F113B80|nr:FtsX-like permease family protein [Niabella hibiscisoli]MCH5718641.1 ABC transporter permease [Niabella hibiscisoli]
MDNQWILWSSFVLFAMLLGVLAGFIPAKILSRFKPVNVLKGTIAPAAMGKTFLRNMLVVIQFVASACFIFIVASMFGQFQYMATDNTNFNRENIYNIAVSENQRLLQQDILANQHVERVGLVSTPFGGNAAQASVAKNAQSESVAASYYAANSDFIINMNLSILAGSNLISSVSDSASAFVLVNEQLLSALGLGKTQDAVGKTFMMNNKQEVTIGGVTSNFCYSNYQFTAKPLIIQYNPQQFHVLNIKTKNKVEEQRFKSEMNTIWKKYFPHTELSFSNYQKDMYERYFPGGDMNIVGTFCVVVLTIALMGLLGIVTYHNEMRTKEVGIRKVMGAPVREIIRQLSKSFIKLTLISGLISLPLGYVICYLFMKLFVYSYGVNLLLLCTLFTSIFGMALITIIYKSAHAAIANPVKSLRTE